MDKGMQSLLNVVLSVLVPVLILEHCSAHGSGLLDLGPYLAMGIALAFPIGLGLWGLIRHRKVDPVTFIGLLGTILTGVVTFYATQGEAAALRPDTPWWYAAKEALIPLLLGGIMVVTTKSETSMLRVFVYSDALFDIPRIERCISEQGKQREYERVQWRASLLTAASLFVSAIANFLLALGFLLPVLRESPEQQPIAYNQAVGNMTWCGYLIIGVPLMITLILVMRYLMKRLGALTGLSDVTMPR